VSEEPFSAPVLVSRIPAGGKHFSLAPGEAERAAIATTLDIVAVEALAAEFDLRPVGADAFAVRGTVNATVVQTDVVTLDPVRQDVSEAIDLRLLPAEGAALEKESPARGDLETTDERDLYRHGRIDLGALVVEHLALGLDPYPRGPGVKFSGHLESSPEAESSPFAALSTLKRERE
jgi:uncharacterized metal-binding protein YceD (DUF177 family)